MWVKICANTNFEDAMLAAELGADAVGFVFAPSKRQVTAGQVAAITARLPPELERVGVFDAHDQALILETTHAAGLTSAQLHGGLDLDLLERLAGKVRLIQALHWTVGDAGSAERLSVQLEHVAASGLVDRVLIDSKLGAEHNASSRASGGTGIAFDWSAAGAVFDAAPKALRLIVAGGLRPENVASSILQLRPWGVDVATGVEAIPGRKDPSRLAHFVSETRRTLSHESGVFL